MTTTSPITKLDKLPGRFDDLVALYPPHAIVDGADYDNTVEVIDALLRLTRPTKGQQQYLLTLSQLVGVYDDEHHAPNAKISGLDLLRGLLEDHGMNAGDLGRLLGDRTLGYKLLKGERALSKEHLRRLGEHFALDPGAFLG